MNSCLGILILRMKNGVSKILNLDSAVGVINLGRSVMKKEVKSI